MIFVNFCKLCIPSAWHTGWHTTDTQINVRGVDLRSGEYLMCIWDKGNRSYKEPIANKIGRKGKCYQKQIPSEPSSRISLTIV